MLQKSTAITWVTLSEAFNHVLQNERDRWVTERLLRHALADGRVRSRGYIVSAYAENMAEPLPRSLFMISDDEYTTTTTFDIEANSIRHTDGWYSDSNCVVRRVEIAWEDLIKVWRMPAKLSRGRKPKYDRDLILREADAELTENGSPRSLEDLANRVTDRLADAGEPAPGRTRMIELLRPKYAQLRESAKARRSISEH